MGRNRAHIDIILAGCLVLLGALAISFRTQGPDAGAVASLAGALFGAAALLFGNWVNRLHTAAVAEQMRTERRDQLQTVIAEELVNVGMGLVGAHAILTAAAERYAAGETPPGQLDLLQHLPRPMPFAESLGSELLAMDANSVSRLAMLRANLNLTRIEMQQHAPAARLTMGLSATAAQQLVESLTHAMGVLADTVQAIAPERKVHFPGRHPQLLSDLLRVKAATPRD